MFISNTAGGGGYQISRSVRLRSSASGNFSRTPASAGNRKTWTWSGWVKRGTFSTNNSIFSAGLISGTYYYSRLYFDSNNNLIFYNYSDTASIQATTAGVFRDPAAWYHIVCAVDTTQATNSNGVKIWINGVQQTLTFANYTQNADTMFNTTSYTDWVGKFVTGGANDYFDGYLTEINFVDGQQLTPSSFGSTNAITGVWQPAKYTGTYGTNGFYLNFGNNASTTTLGYDTSGNSNNWTTNNISLTAGVTYDSMIDVPTNYADGGNGRGNYAVMNPLNYAGTVTPSNGNLTVTSASDNGQVAGSIGMDSGKWYYEHTITTVGGENSAGIGGSLISNNSGYVGFGASQYGYLNDGTKRNNATGVAYGASFTTGDVIGVAYDAGAGSLTFYKNGSSQGVAFTGVTGTMFPLASVRSTGGQNNSNLNFGQRPFTYTPPTGFNALNTQNLPTPTIANGAQYMAATTYTGTGTTAQNIVNGVNGQSFQPDFVWIKNRSISADHQLIDSVRGVNIALQSNQTNAEFNFGSMPSFNSNGFQVVVGGGGAYTGTNNSGSSFVGWQWKAGGTAVSNTAGTITSSVSANTTAGFSVVGYTGTSANATVGHGLGVAPSMIITKVRSTGGADWGVYHASVGNTKCLFLDTTAVSSTSVNFWNNTSPTSTVFSVGISGSTNNSGNTMIAYCFAAVTGYSAFGSYTGNGSADGPFVYCGFRPRYVMVKRTDSADNWIVIDTTRSPSNVVTDWLFPNTADSTYTYSNPDILSNGFKQRNTGTGMNASGGTYIYMAFAENPAKFALAR